jgi:hypothetical protein
MVSLTVNRNNELVDVPIGTMADTLTVLYICATPNVPDVGVGDGVGVKFTVCGIIVVVASNFVGMM